MQQQIGAMRERVCILVPQHESDDMGGYKKSWKSTGIINWASIEPQSLKTPSDKMSKGRVLGVEDKGEITYKVRMRFSPFFKPDMALKWRDLILVSTTPLLHDPMKKWSELLVQVLKDKMQVIHD
ncbi:head-tail adaptor protein [Candidatus Nucleicultrix amoebiphila]|jgi:head-tail adaptor|uniref:Uncharacterized protein n=1 Tax=Candidatus Nucleicultrix amoebiphila FS5 TaxID=1414854 RepID=A0A1W6N360_9PROT|nr:head-tail adaptor protein [Candidatus Nucleicultrix amoebiphila]ARN84327.1 hypothetical protein GQ61_02120 [Candidatus Nucleicultrix amoebiphila FS5]